ncbi:hypothetical protein ACE106_15490 [Shouchella clausii]|nr:hypothetical protein [Shouchella clausii]
MIKKTLAVLVLASILGTCIVNGAVAAQSFKNDIIETNSAGQIDVRP